MVELTGWLLDVYADSDGGVALWLLGEDGQRHRLRQPFPVTFYVAGSVARLRALWGFLQNQPVRVELSRVERCDLFTERPVTLLAIQVEQAAAQARLFQQVSGCFPDLTYYDADIPLPLRYAAVHAAFPLARCRVALGQDGLIREMETLDSPWDLDLPAPPLRILELEPETNPARSPPEHLLARCGRFTYRLSFQPARPLLVNLGAILRRHDPDLLLTNWGDTWLIPYLLLLARQARIPLPLNRDPNCAVASRPEKTYFSYGQVIYRGRQAHLFGRWHIDRHNAMLWGDYELEGVLEIARVTALPVQTAARVSPGTGISAMQMLTALRQAILVPWHKQQVERPKTARDLFATDQGGLVYQPLLGLHRDVAGIDFVSMYPGIMVRFNISPETTGPGRLDALNLTRLETPFGRGGAGLVPQTLAPLLRKRLAFKNCLATLPHWDVRYRSYQARSAAHKWLLVTCFGYLGYKNARFGRIEAHEAVTSYGREALLEAKEVAEDLGFTVLHLYVDGLWVKKPGATTAADFQPVLDAIAQRTRLPIALDGIYRWVAFLPSRLDERVPVANRYFGVFRDGSLKVRGVEARRRDAPAFVAETQLQILELLARAPDASGLAVYVPQALALLSRRVAQLHAGNVPLEKLVVGQKLSRELAAYRSPSPAARAAAQLQAAGKAVHAGQRIRFLYTLGEPGVYAWDLAEPPDPASLDVGRYKKLLLRAAEAVLEPVGAGQAGLQARLFDNASPLQLPIFSSRIV